jgi:dCTP deaminase
MIKNDKWIKEMASEKKMIYPFFSRIIRQVFVSESEGFKRGAISYGLSSYGYDIRLSDKEFWIFRHQPGTVVDPKNFDPNNLEKEELKHDSSGSYFILPGNSYGLGVSKERIIMPPSVTANCIGKSTYARCGIIVNTTPLEAGWRGHITLEFSNSSEADCRIYANEGIAQLQFFEGDPCIVSYEDRKGKYQNQPERVVIARV